MTRVWNAEAFRSTVRESLGSDELEVVSSRLGLKTWVAETLLFGYEYVPPGLRLKPCPHSSELSWLEHALRSPGARKKWIVDDPGLSAGAREYDTPYSTAKPTGALGRRWRDRDTDAMREFLRLFSKFCDKYYVLAVGQQLRLTDKGIEFFLLDRGGKHHYDDAARELGIDLVHSRNLRPMRKPLSPFWLESSHRKGKW